MARKLQHYLLIYLVREGQMRQIGSCKLAHFCAGHTAVSQHKLITI